jgi:cell division protein FtsZ
MDFYNIFENNEEENENGRTDNEESFIEETPFEKVEIIVSSEEENEINEIQDTTKKNTVSKTSEQFSEKDPLGIAGKNTSHTNINQSKEAMKFDLPEHSSIIKVIGVGGGGSNAVNHMYRQGIKGVDFIVCNTDKQALDMSPVPHKVVLGATLTEGRGAGSLPEVGRNAAIENIEDIRSFLANNTKMVFITAGMGGGTGTGAAPIIAGIAREMGILTVAIVTVPFLFEGKKRRVQAEEGLEQLKQNVDTLLVICNDKLREMYGNLKLSDAFSHADDVLAIAAKSIAEIISLTQQINVDFADVCTVMRNSGVAIMGSAVMAGENRSIRAVEASLNSPLLNDNNITGARYVLLNIVSGSNEITMDELGEITDYIQEAAGQTAEIIKGYGVDPELGDNVNVTIIATGFNQNNPVAYEYSKKPATEKVVLKLDENKSEKVVEAVKEETKTETVNPLEPFLVSKQPEPVAEVKSESVSEPVAEITNPLEPFLITKEPEVVAEVVTPVAEEVIEPVAEVVTLPMAIGTEVKVEEVVAPVAEEIVAPVAEIKVEEEIIAPVAEEVVAPVAEIVTPIAEEVIAPVAEVVTPVAEEIVTPVAEISEVSESVSEITSEPVAEITSEPVAETWSEETVAEEIAPVINTNVEFEITNLNPTSSEEKSSWEVTSEETSSEIVSENWEQPVAEKTVEPVAEISEVSEPVAEITSEPIAEVSEVSEPVAEIKSEPVAETNSSNEPFLIKKEELVAETTSELVAAKPSEEEIAKKIATEELQRKAQDRIQKLKELSLKLKTPQGLNEMEHEPAYKRRNINLENVPHSSESQVSRYTLSENEEKKVEIRPNNSFLHDNVD